MKLNLSNYNIIKIVEDISLSVVIFVESKGIKLIFDTDIEEKITACDPNIIERIILNLLSNAIKFTDIGGKITVNIFDKGKNIFISVQDTGDGISKEDQVKIFQRFSQVDGSLSRNSEGSGIGLSLVKSFVEMHGGKITVDSCLGKGSNFIFNLPIKIVETPQKIDVEPVNSNNMDAINVEFSDIYS